jgi:hypothetical protein
MIHPVISLSTYARRAPQLGRASQQKNVESLRTTTTMISGRSREWPGASRPTLGFQQTPSFNTVLYAIVMLQCITAHFSSYGLL